MRQLEERLKLRYMDQVEFIRFRDIAFECEKQIRQIELTLLDLKRKEREALDEIERLFEADKRKEKELENENKNHRT